MKGGPMLLLTHSGVVFFTNYTVGQLSINSREHELEFSSHLKNIEQL